MSHVLSCPASLSYPNYLLFNSLSITAGITARYPISMMFSTALVPPSLHICTSWRVQLTIHRHADNMGCFCWPSVLSRGGRWLRPCRSSFFHHRSAAYIQLSSLAFFFSSTSIKSPCNVPVVRVASFLPFGYHISRSLVLCPRVDVFPLVPRVFSLLLYSIDVPLGL